MKTIFRLMVLLGDTEVTDVHVTVFAVLRFAQLSNTLDGRPYHSRKERLIMLRVSLCSAME